jgi:hypothetical protein
MCHVNDKRVLQLRGNFLKIFINKHVPIKIAILHAKKISFAISSNSY